MQDYKLYLRSNNSSTEGKKTTKDLMYSFVFLEDANNVNIVNSNTVKLFNSNEPQLTNLEIGDVIIRCGGGLLLGVVDENFAGYIKSFYTIVRFAKPEYGKLFAMYFLKHRIRLYDRKTQGQVIQNFYNNDLVSAIDEFLLMVKKPNNFAHWETVSQIYYALDKKETNISKKEIATEKFKKYLMQQLFNK